jgi:hypothetical protein
MWDWWVRTGWSILSETQQKNTHELAIAERERDGVVGIPTTPSIQTNYSLMDFQS